MGRLLTTKEVAERLRVSPSTLRWWRQIDYDGPKGFKVGEKKVVYDESEIEAYLARQQEASDPQRTPLPEDHDGSGPSRQAQNRSRRSRNPQPIPNSNIQDSEDSQCPT